MVQTNQKLHLGCGENNFSGWVNIDLDSPTADRLLDLTQSLPFEDSSVSHIFNEHFIEHVTREQAVAFLKECYRVLSSQGAIRISTPNLRYLVHCYFFDNKNEWGNLWQPSTKCQMMNEGMRSWGHQFVYDAEELTRVLGEAGFKSIAFQVYRQSADEVFTGLECRPFHNELIVEACKSSAIDDVDIDFSAVAANEATWNLHSTISAQTFEQTLVKVELESAARAEFIKTESAHIREVETALEDQERKNQMLKSQLEEVEAKLKVFHSSLCGRIKSFFNGTVE